MSNDQCCQSSMNVSYDPNYARWPNWNTSTFTWPTTPTEVALSVVKDEKRWVDDHFEPLFLVRMLKDNSTIKLTLAEIDALGFKVVTFDSPKEETEVVVDVVLDIPQLLREAADMMEKEQG